MHISLKRFQSLFSWNLWGSITFETLKVGHNFLLASLMPGDMYGFIGMIFATVYSAARIADFGTAYSLLSFFKPATHSKSNFKHIFLNIYGLPLIPFFLITSCIATIIFYYKWSMVHNIMLMIIPLLIIGEALRSILRQFLHTAFKSKAAILIELYLFFGYLGVVWGLYFFGHWPLTPNLIFIPFFIDSLLALICFSLLIVPIYRHLADEPLNVPANMSRRITTTRIFDYLMRLSREAFTVNMITPLFALKFGLKEAGLFYIASMTARSLYSVIRSAIGHPGNAILAQLKHEAHGEKKAAFTLLSTQLMMVVLPTVTLIGLNYQKLLTLSLHTTPTNMTILFSLMYLLITVSELFFMPYEQFYVLEEAMGTLFAFKLFECLTFYGCIATSTTISPLAMLISIVGIRCLTFSMVFIHAFYRWGIRPSFTAPLRFVGACVSISLIVSLFFSR